MRVKQRVEVKLKIQPYVSSETERSPVYTHTYTGRSGRNYTLHFDRSTDALYLPGRLNLDPPSSGSRKGKLALSLPAATFLRHSREPVDFHCKSAASVPAATGLTCVQLRIWNSLIARTAKGEPTDWKGNRHGPSLPSQRSCGFSCSPFQLQAPHCESPWILGDSYLTRAKSFLLDWKFQGFTWKTRFAMLEVSSSHYLCIPLGTFHCEFFLGGSARPR